MVAFDIHFTSQATGAEVEPNKPVDVKIEIVDAAAAGVPEDAVGGVTIAHILDQGGAEIVSEPERLPVEDEESSSDVAGFKTDSFSTFTVTWGNSKVTIHYGYMDGTTFKPFEPEDCTNNNFPTTLSWSDYYYYTNGYAYLKYDFNKYVYKETRLTSTDGTLITPVLHASTSYGSSRWQYTTLNNNNWSNLSNNGNVYVIYEPIVVTSGGSSGGGEGGGETEIPDLPAEKTVEPNGDGTYDITLSVTGVETEEKATKASVIVIFDTSGSMERTMGGQSTYSDSQKRLRIAKDAVEALANTLLNKKDSDGNKLVHTLP